MPLSCQRKDVCRVFSPWRGNMSPSKCTSGRGTFSFSAIQEISTPLCMLLCQYPLSRSTRQTFFLSKVAYFQNLRIWALHDLCIKSLWYSVPLFSQSMVQRFFFFSLRACECILSIPNSLFFPFPLQKEKVSSPHGITNFSLPQFTSMHLPPSMLSPSNYGDPSPSLQISFLNVLSDLTSIHLCSGTRKATGPPSSLPS